MSITAQYCRILADAGHDVEDIILCARAMERGEARDEMFALIDPLVVAGVDVKNIAKGMCEMARRLIEYESTPWTSGPGVGCAVKLRLGISKGAWNRLREAVFQRDGHECEYCGGDADTVDHVMPVSLGGTNDLSNLVPACRSCNSSKRDKTLEEWMGHA